MDKDALAKHWNGVYGSRDLSQASWFQREPAVDLDLLANSGKIAGSRVLDVGGGASVFIDRLLDAGYHVGVLDVSAIVMGLKKADLGPAADDVEWFEGDVRTFVSPHEWDVWHDRAVFHFFTDPVDRAAYRATLTHALAPDGIAIIATFGPHGPERCSGLPTRRYGSKELAEELGPGFELIESRVEMHGTPQNVDQEFVYGVFRRAPG